MEQMGKERVVEGGVSKFNLNFDKSNIPLAGQKQKKTHQVYPQTTGTQSLKTKTTLTTITITEQ